MVDDIKNIDKPLNPLFQVPTLKKVREVSKRPEDDRSGRDTYSESDEILLSDEAERLIKDKSARAKELSGKDKEAKKTEISKEKPEEDEQDKTGGRKKHINVIV